MASERLNNASRPVVCESLFALNVHMLCKILLVSLWQNVFLYPYADIL
jgi:hypothetical protein